MKLTAVATAMSLSAVASCSPAGLLPLAQDIGSVLFSALSGCNGATLQYNVGNNLVEHPMVHAVLSADYTPAGMSMAANPFFSKVAIDKYIYVSCILS